jgi:hypothetical protein
MHLMMLDLFLEKIQQTQRQIREEHGLVIHEHNQALECVMVLNYDEHTVYIGKHEMLNLLRSHEHLINQQQVLIENQFFLLKIK